MGRHVKILYRGPLSSCNYRCDYCPFAKRRESKSELDVDRNCLKRFVNWIHSRPQHSHGILFTPWGEALTRRWYRESMIELSQLKQIQKVAVQTNLSCKLDWLEQVNREKVGLWCTYHPEEVDQQVFLDQCQQLDRIGIRYSVGVVGLSENIEAAESLRRSLSSDVYLWINAYKREENYYDASTFKRYQAIDPLFHWNAIRHKSLGAACRTGDSVVSIDGVGDVRRCHFVDQHLGNIYTDELESLLLPTVCPNQTCGCHIGYVHMPALNLYDQFGEGVLERIPSTPVWNDPNSLDEIRRAEIESMVDQKLVTIRTSADSKVSS